MSESKVSVTFMFPWQIMTKCQKVSKWSENTACVRAIFNTLLWKEHSVTLTE